MKFQHKLLLSVGTSCFLLTGCIDDKYDLSDIDTTSEFKVNDLVIPVNLDPVTMSDIIKVKEGGRITEYTLNGNTFFAVEQTGDFYSDGIDVKSFTAEPDPMNDRTAVFHKKNEASKPSHRKAGGSTSIFTLQDPVIGDLSYKATDIDGAVRALTTIYFDDLRLEIDLLGNPLDGGVESRLENVVLQLPQGLSVSKISAGDQSFSPDSYTPSSGRLILAEVNLTDNSALIVIEATAIDLNGYDKPFNYDPLENAGSFLLNSEFNIEESDLVLTGPEEALAGIDEITYNVKYTLGELSAQSILGNIEYNLTGTGLEIEPIELEDLPSFLDNENTNLIIANPQIYLGMDNPVGEFGLFYQSTLDIVAVRPDNANKEFESPLIKVPAKEGDYNFLLAAMPDKVVEIPSDYAGSTIKLEYENLDYIVSGNGMPERLDVSLINPIIPEQTVSSPFRVGEPIEGMQGHYLFLAPLALKEGSKIVKRIDGWWSEDLADLTIDKLTISAMASSTLESAVQIHVYPIDREGNRIPTVADTAISLEPMAENTPIELVMEGVITDLDGIELYVMTACQDDEPLAPSQTITLENLKAKVSGTFLKKL